MYSITGSIVLVAMSICFHAGAIAPDKQGVLPTLVGLTLGPVGVAFLAAGLITEARKRHRKTKGRAAMRDSPP